MILRRTLAYVLVALSVVALVRAAGPAFAAAGDVVLVSTSATGERANGQAGQPWLSADGTHVAFGTSATNLSPLDTDSRGDV